MGEFKDGANTGGLKVPLAVDFPPSLALIPHEVLRSKEDALKVSAIGLKTILGDIRVRNVISKRVERAFLKRKENFTYKSGFAFAMLAALVHTQTREAINRNARNPLRALKASQLDTLLTAWTYLQIGEKIITATNVLKFNPSYKINASLELNYLCEAGFLNELDAVEIHRLTGKIPKPPKKGRMPQSFVINRTGIKLLEQYFELYEAEHKRLTGRMWETHLIKLGPPLPNIEDEIGQ